MTTVERIQDLLQKNSISAYKLSKIIGLNKTFLTDWKSGKANPSVDALSKIADYFHVSVDYLLGRTEWTIDDYAQGVVDTKRASITADEESCLDLFRQIERETGAAGVQLFMEFGETILKKHRDG